MEIFEIILCAFITTFSVCLLFISLASYKKYKSIKLVFVSIVFFVFLMKGIFLSLYIFEIYFPVIDAIILLGFFDFVILILLFMATLKR